MATRYVWKKRVYTSASLDEPLETSATIVLDNPNLSIILCEYTSTGLNSYGKPCVSPQGNSIYIMTNGNVSSSNISYPTTTYPIAIFQYNDATLDHRMQSARVGTYYWRIKYNSTYNEYEFYLSSSPSGDINTAAVRYDYAIKTESTLTTVSSANRNTYGDYVYDNTARAAFYYSGSDNIDPISITYPTSLKYEGSSISFNCVINPSTSNTYGGTISYNIGYKKNSDNWVHDGNWSTQTTRSRIISDDSWNTYQLRVIAKDNWGFVSTTNITGPVGIVIKASKPLYIGISSTARKVPKMYIGINGVARKVKKAYIGVNGVARLFFDNS